MKGILLISHGEMANGMIDSAVTFYGDSIGQLDCLCLKKGDNPAVFKEDIGKKIQELDTGDGVVILADLYGGTPCNQAVMYLNEKVDLISGMNFGLLLELLEARNDQDINLAELIEAGENGIRNLKKQLTEMNVDDE